MEKQFLTIGFKNHSNNTITTKNIQICCSNKNKKIYCTKRLKGLIDTGLFSNNNL